MARVAPAQTNFTAGELSEQLLGREDIQRYSAGVRELQNFVVMPHGGARRREGTRFVAETKTSAKRSRLVAFEYSIEQAYVLEFGDLYMRVYKDSGQVESSPGVPYEITTPFTEDELDDLQFAQTADVMYITHPSHNPRSLTRTGHTSWTLTSLTFVDGPYLPENATAVTLTPSGTTGAITLTASAATFNAAHAPTATEPGAIFRINHGGTQGYARVTSFVSATVVNATVISAFGGTTAQTAWREGAWSVYRGFPRAVAFFEERLYFGGNSFKPQTLWGSAIGAFEDHTPGVADDDAVAYTISSGKMNAIQWMEGKDELFIGTAGGEFLAGDPAAPLTPTNVRIRSQTTYGSAYVRPVRISHAVLFLQRSRRKLREMRFNLADDAYRAPDLSLLAEHITAGGITQLAYAQEPDSLVWAVRSDGVLLGMTYDLEQEIVAWHRLVTSGLVESVASIPVTVNGGDEGYDQTWVIVNRTVGGATKRYVEFIERRFEAGTAIEDAFFVDSGLSYDGAPTSTLSGLDHLEGLTVQVLADGSVHPDRVVSGGAISLVRQVTKASAGLGYTSRIRTLPAISGAQDGTTQGKRKSWGRYKARLFRALGIKVNGGQLPLRRSTDAMDEPLQPYTGIRETQLVGWDDEAEVTIEQTLPLPCTVLSLFGTLQVEDS